MGKFGSGHVVNLASNDIHQLDEVCCYWIKDLFACTDINRV